MLDINFADGCNNAVELMIMESSEKTDRIIQMFKSRYKISRHPYDLLDEIYEELHIDEAVDLTDTDCDRLSRELTKIVRGER